MQPRQPRRNAASVCAHRRRIVVCVLSDRGICQERMDRAPDRDRAHGRDADRAQKGNEEETKRVKIQYGAAFAAPYFLFKKTANILDILLAMLYNENSIGILKNKSQA